MRASGDLLYLGMILPESFYLREDVVRIARELLGKVLVTHIDGIRTSATIVETEAYGGITDKASHAYGGRRTNRTEVMYSRGGVAYVFLCYGIHHLFNVVTNAADVPHAVLIRAAEPAEGLEAMLQRRGKTTLKPALTAGPGALSAALGIHTGLTGVGQSGNGLRIEDRGIEINDADIIAATRVGVAYAGTDALLPYRFYLKGNKFVSKSKGL